MTHVRKGGDHPDPHWPGRCADSQRLLGALLSGARHFGQWKTNPVAHGRLVPHVL